MICYIISLQLRFKSNKMNNFYIPLVNFSIINLNEFSFLLLGMFL